MLCSSPGLRRRTRCRRAAMSAGGRSSGARAPPEVALALSLRCAQLLLATAHLAVIRGGVRLLQTGYCPAPLIALGNEGFVLAPFRLQSQLFRCDVRGVCGPLGCVGVEAPSLDLPDARSYPIEEVAVVRNDDITAGIIGHERFEPADRRDVEMIGRFVENQVVRLVDQHVS